MKEAATALIEIVKQSKYKQILVSSDGINIQGETTLEEFPYEEKIKLINYLVSNGYITLKTDIGITKVYVLAE